jgi:hypothetical protein
MFSLSQCLRSTYEYTRMNLYDAQFGYFGHLQMIWHHEMMCDVMKTTLSEDTTEGSDLLKLCIPKIGQFR